MTMVPLCVPFEDRHDARAAGAVWSKADRCHLVSTAVLAEKGRGLRRWLPRRFRLDLTAPYLRPWPVPQPLWGWNLRSLLDREQWDMIRRAAYAQAGYRCRVCGEKGPDHPVEADEGWAYDDATRTQTLKGIAALCPNCHGVRHWGRSMMLGREAEALRWMAHINRQSVEESQALVDLAMDQWRERSHQTWTCDVSWVERTYGFSASPEGIDRAIAAQNKLEAQARDQSSDSGL